MYINTDAITYDEDSCGPIKFTVSSSHANHIQFYESELKIIFNALEVGTLQRVSTINIEVAYELNLAISE